MLMGWIVANTRVPLPFHKASSPKKRSLDLEVYNLNYTTNLQTARADRSPAVVFTSSIYLQIQAQPNYRNPTHPQFSCISLLYSPTLFIIMNKIIVLCFLLFNFLSVKQLELYLATAYLSAHAPRSSGPSRERRPVHIRHVQLLISF